MIRPTRNLDPAVGLCSLCRHVKTIANRRGSTFHLCTRADDDDRFARYPRLPVSYCPGFEATAESVADPGPKVPEGGCR